MTSMTTAVSSDASTAQDTAVVASPDLSSCWAYAQTSNLRDRCTPADWALIEAAYAPAYLPTGDATVDDRRGPTLLDDILLTASHSSIWWRAAA